MNLRMPHPIRARRTQRAVDTHNSIMLMMEAAVIILGKQTIKHAMIVKHEPRPPAPRPSRLSIIWEMQDGTEWREYVNLHGQRSTTQSPPQFLRGGYEKMMPPVTVRYEFGYEDGGSW